MLGLLLNRRYRVDAELGLGGMGVIYRAYDTLLERNVALKVIMLAEKNRKARQRLLNEAKSAAKLNHPNIVSVFDAGEAVLESNSDTTPFVVMELVQGETLFECPPKDLKDITMIACQICAALAHAHAQNIVHRDLKPENVLITSEGTVKLTDFGLAQLATHHMVGEKDITGTIYYLSPEAAQGKSIDTRADLYALGVMLYEWTTGSLPFENEDPLTIVSGHIHESVIPPRDKNPQIPLRLNDLILDLLEKDPDRRPSSAAEVINVLNKIEESTETKGLEPKKQTLLRTKLFIPVLRSEVIQRPRLINILDSGINRKFTLMSAPAGFGKTTLLSSWITNGKYKVGWLSLDRDDNDPVRFWVYLVAAIQNALGGGFGEMALMMLQSRQVPKIEHVLANMINEITDAVYTYTGSPYILVLDDFHLITNPEIQTGVTFFLDNLPPNFHVIIASRTDPPWPLARRRARRELVEIRAKDLRFTLDEVSAFLNTVMKLNLSNEEVEKLDSRTEGWIAGLQLAGLSMRDRSNISGFITEFTGSNRFVLDYLVEEILDRQPEHIRDFLLKTSILERMSSPLCDSVIGGCNSQLILSQLEQANLFLVPLDDERRWYRYHHLFADLLRNRLQQDLPDQVQQLHHQAIKWFDQEGLYVEAVSHALTTGDVDWIERLVVGNTLPAAYYGELELVNRWIEALPEDVVRSRPWLSIAHAAVLTYSGRLDSVESVLIHAEEAMGRQENLDALEIQRINGHIAYIRGHVAVLREDLSKGEYYSYLALENLPETDLVVRGSANLVLGCIFRMQGRLDESEKVFEKALEISYKAKDPHLGVDVLWETASLFLLEGRLHQTLRVCEEALELATEYTQRGGHPLPMRAYSYIRMGDVYYQWNDLDMALNVLQKGLSISKQWGQADSLTQSYIYLGRALYAKGDIPGALEALAEAKEIGKELGPWYTLTPESIEANIRISQGDKDAGLRWIAKANETAQSSSDISRLISSVSGRLLYLRGDLDKAMEVIQSDLEKTKASGASFRVINMLIYQSLIYFKKNQLDQALDKIEQVLSLTVSEGFIRVFINEGEPMAALLRHALERGIFPEYVKQLLAVFGEVPRISPEPTTTSVPASPLLDPLTERELEVLRLLQSSLTHSEIADELFISVSTVRSHVKRIYSKLDVHNRMEAVEHAREIGLIRG